jgi:hypothetical protein
MNRKPLGNQLLGLSFYLVNRCSGCSLYVKKAENDLPDNSDLLFRRAVLSLSKGENFCFSLKMPTG